MEKMAKKINDDKNQEIGLKKKTKSLYNSNCSTCSHS